MFSRNRIAHIYVGNNACGGGVGGDKSARIEYVSPAFTWRRVRVRYARRKKGGAKGREGDGNYEERGGQQCQGSNAAAPPDCRNLNSSVRFSPDTVTTAKCQLNYRVQFGICTHVYCCEVKNGAKQSSLLEGWARNIL